MNACSIKNHGIDYLIRKDVNQLEGIYGKIKTIYEDFHVHEITKKNEILHLNYVIDKNIIKNILEENEKKEDANIIYNITNKEEHFHILSQYLSEYNRKVFSQFLNILYEMYQLKNENETEQKDNDGDDNKEYNKQHEKCKYDENKNAILNEQIFCSHKNNASIHTIPYCVLTNLDDLFCDIKIDNSEDIYDSKNIEEKKKIIRKNIHKIIKQYYPFLLTETKNVNNIDQVISHGNILLNHHINDSINHINTSFLSSNNNNNNINVIQVYPSLDCLRCILSPSLFKKLKGTYKKSRYNKTEELEYIINQHFHKINKKKLDFSQEISESHLSDSYNNNYVKTNDHILKLRLNISTSHHNDNSINITYGKKRKLDNDGCEKIETLNMKHSMNHINVNHINENDNMYCNLNNNLNMKNDNDINNTYKLRNNICDINLNNNNNFLDNINHIKKKKSELKKKKKYLHFNLYKENKDICEILNKFKMNLSKKNTDISYCGIKDKRAITVQKFCIHKTTKYDIYNLISNNNNKCFYNNVYISNLEYKRKKLSLGNLNGNHFKVIIRGVHNNAKANFHILSENLRTKGFVNYYGHQRFGTKQIKNYEIGISILKRNYKESLSYVIENTELKDQDKKNLITYINKLTDHSNYEKAIVKKKNQHPNEHIKNENSIKKIYINNDQKQNNHMCSSQLNESLTDTKKKKKNDISKRNHNISAPQEIINIINSISSHSYVEKTILNSIKNSNNLKNAFMNLPKDIFSLFIHAIQSIVFNLLVNIRMKKFGFQVALGDLVEIYEHHSGYSSLDESSDDNTSDNTNNNNMLYESKIISITENNISLYNIYDVVLPLPGDKNIIFPPNLKEEYVKVLETINLTLEDFKSEKHFFNASGCYRKIVVKPYNFKSIFIKNELNDLNKIPIIKSDLYKLKNENKKNNTFIKEELPNKTNEGSSQIITEQQNVEDELIYVSNEQYHEYLIKEIPDYQTTSSIYLTCSLPKSSYITVALMELLKN
ncbi:U2 snRNA/tRNA pseudouridine synthase,putative [Plasmodium sp. DRC-Itaito]|nr:U2 snRNA/tRNA pseudouridine synthase,putative [Plasmodium sp. DRC-Itaito]